MKHFVVLVAFFGLTAAEKLNRAYLPPPGAKYAGGSIDDLETPHEHPNESLSNDPSEYGEGNIYAADGNDVNIGAKDDTDFSPMVTNAPFSQSAAYVTSGKTTENNEYGIENPENIPIYSVPETKVQNVQSNLFEKHGVRPMNLQPFGPNIDPLGLDESIPSDKIINLPGRNMAYKEAQIMRNQQSDQYIPKIIQNESTVSYTTDKQIGQKPSYKKSERTQANSDRNAVILNYENVINPNGYFYNFDTSNGIHKDESASTLNGVKAKGSYSYMGDDGKVYTVTYTADENGFQPSGDHLPKTPEAIQKVIDQAKRDKEAGIFDDGSYDERKYGHMKYQGPINRYLQGNAKIQNRKIESGKPFEPQIIQNHETKDFMKRKPINMRRKINKNIKPYGTKNVKVFGNSRKEENENQVNMPNARGSQQSNSRPSLQNGSRRNFTMEPKIVYGNQQSPDFATNPIQVLINKVGSNLAAKIFQSNPHSPNPRHKVNESSNNDKSSDDGYFYVPPKYMFVDEKYQDKPFEVLNTKPVPVLKVYDNNQTNDQIPDKENLKKTQFIATTEEPYGKTYDNRYFTNTNPDENQLHDIAKATTRTPSNIKTGTETTEQPHTINTLSTSPDYQEFTKDIFLPKDIVVPENRVTDLTTQNDLGIKTFQSTTPMYSETRYKDLTYDDANENKTTEKERPTNNNNNNVHDFETSTDMPTTFEDFPSSRTTYNQNIDTIAGIVSTENSPNAETDEFGKPVQYISGYFTNSPLEIVTDEMQINTLQSSTPFDYFEEIFKTSPVENISVTKFPYFESNVEKETPGYLDNGKYPIIGEDFSGPKQPQRYDPEHGYYY